MKEKEKNTEENKKKRSLFKRVRLKTKKGWRTTKKRLRKYASPAFLVMLLISLTLWYLTKLSHTYTAKVPMTIELSGEQFKVDCVAEGTGYRIVSHRFLRRRVMILNFGEVRTSPSVLNEGGYVIDPYSLQNAISVRNTDLKIISVGDLPEIKPQNR